MEILKENIEKGYLVAKVDATDKFGVLREMGNVLVEKGWVKDTYPGAVIEREKVFPTGLPMEAMGVAIPHTDAIHVNKKAVFCGILDKPVDFPLCLLCALIHAVVTFKLADWTAPAVGSFLELPGVCLPHAETVAWAPVCYALNRVWDKIPGLNKVDVTGDTLKKKLGFIGEPMFLGLVLGLIIGALAGYDSKQVILTGVNMAAVLVLLPRMVSLLMEGLMPISEGARNFIQKRFPGKEVYIGLDAAVATGHPTVVTVSLIMIPITLALAIILPYNRLLPYADFAVLPFTVIWAVVASRGNIVRSVLSSSVMMCGILFIATNMAEATTAMGKAVGFAFPEGATQISGIDASCHILVWVFAKLCDPANMPMFIAGIAVAVIYFGLWYWTRNDVKAQVEAANAAK